MRIRPTLLASALLVTLATGCETFTYAFVNETGRPIQLTVVDRQRGGLAVPLNVGQQMLMRSPVTDVARVEYSYDQTTCRLDEAALRVGEPGWRLIAIPRCEATGGEDD